MGGLRWSQFNLTRAKAQNLACSLVQEKHFTPVLGMMSLFRLVEEAMAQTSKQPKNNRLLAAKATLKNIAQHFRGLTIFLST